MNILIINGPNLNMLGKRESSIYGKWTLKELEKEMVHTFPQCNFIFFQSNSESAIVEKIHSVVTEDIEGIIINPAAFTHTSVAIADALKILEIPVIEVHISNIMQRENFRHFSYVSPVAVGQITGFGKYSYFLAVNALLYLSS